MNSFDHSPKSVSKHSSTRGSFQLEDCLHTPASPSSDNKNLGAIGTRVPREEIHRSFRSATSGPGIERNHLASNLFFRATCPQGSQNYQEPAECREPCESGQGSASGINPRPNPSTPSRRHPSRSHSQHGLTPLCEGLVRKNKKEKKHFSDLVEAIEEERLISEEDINLMGNDEIFNIVAGGKSSALALQVLLEQCSPACTAKVQSVVREKVETLIVHRTGSYLVQKLLTAPSQSTPTPEEFTSRVVSVCQESFTALASNEFASRVMQRLLEVNYGFREFVIRSLLADLSPFVRDFSAVFLVSGALQAAEREEERAYVLRTLSQHPRKWLQNKYFKRVLVTFLQVCSPQELNLAYKLFRQGSSVFSALEEKYCALVLLTFVERGHQAAQYELLRLFSIRLPQMLSLKYFGYFVSQLLRKCSDRSFVERLDLCFRLADTHLFREILAHAPLYTLYSSVVKELTHFLHPTCT